MERKDVVAEYIPGIFNPPIGMLPPMHYTYSRPPTMSDEQFVELTDAVIKYAAGFGMTVLEMQHVFFACTERVLEFPIDADLALAKRWQKLKEQVQK